MEKKNHSEQYASIPSLELLILDVRKRTDYRKTNHHFCSSLSRISPMLHFRAKEAVKLFINDSGNKIKVIKQTDTSLNIKFLVI